MLYNVIYTICGTGEFQTSADGISCSAWHGGKVRYSKIKTDEHKVRNAVPLSV